MPTLVVTRSFQAGATFGKGFDPEKCEKGLIAPIRRLLGTAPAEIAGVVVVTCGEKGSKYAEEVRDDQTPTTSYLIKAFPAEVEAKRVIPIVCDDWGLNPGSATAINDGLRVAIRCEVDRALVWSPEIGLDGHMVTEMLEHQARYNLDLVGYFRNRWWQRAQWMFAQNTCALWDLGLLTAVDGFNAACNGDGKTVVHTIEYGDVPLAGMVDIEAYFRSYRLRHSFTRWGMAGQRHPAVWNLALKRPGTAEYDNNLKKIARQAEVIQAYARQYFPNTDVADVLESVMAASVFA